MNNATSIKLPFGMQDGRIAHISDVPKGLACDCICISCEGILIAAKGSIQQHDFKHHKSAECTAANESALHAAAKQIIAQKLKLTLPAYVLKHFLLPCVNVLQEQETILTICI